MMRVQRDSTTMQACARSIRAAAAAAAWLALGASAAHAAPDTAVPGTDCVAAQQLIGGYAPDALRASTTVTAYDQLSAFVASKATIGSGKINLQVFTPNAVQAGSEYPQLWCKLKSASDIAASRELALPVEAAGVNCDRINAAFLRTALAADPELQALYDRAGYSVEFANTTFRTGAQWAPSVPKIKYAGGKRVLIETTSLESPRGLPVVGGMNYCKLVDARAFKPLLTDLADGNFDRLLIDRRDAATAAAIAGPGLRTAVVTFKPAGAAGNAASQTADLYWPETGLKGSYIISSGGGVKPVQMRALAKGFARSGYAVYVVHYPRDLAVLERITGMSNAATNLGQLLRAAAYANIDALPAELQQRYLDAGTLPLRVFGHSLGGAALGGVIFSDGSPFDDVVLYGTTSFLSQEGKEIKTPALTALFGANDGLSIRKATSIDDFRRELGITNAVGDGRFQAPAGKPHFVQTIPGLNHFCIIADLTAGDARLRGQDRDGAVPSACLATLQEVMAANGLL